MRDREADRSPRQSADGTQREALAEIEISLAIIHDTIATALVTGSRTSFGVTVTETTARFFSSTTPFDPRHYLLKLYINFRQSCDTIN